MATSPFRFITTSILASCLSACSIQGLADKILPADIQQESTQFVDAIMGGDTGFFLERKADLLPPEQLAAVSDEAFAASIRQALLKGAGQTEISRHLVGVNVEVNASLAQGSREIYETVYEIETTEAFVLVSLRLAYREGTKACCEVKLIEARDFTTSPYRKNQALMGKIIAGVGIFATGFIGGLTLIFVRRRRRRTNSPRP